MYLYTFLYNIKSTKTIKLLSEQVSKYDDSVTITTPESCDLCNDFSHKYRQSKKHVKIRGKTYDDIVTNLKVSSFKFQKF